MKFPCILFITICLLGFNSCTKWIDVKPTDRLAEGVLFTNSAGYIKALNGVYSEMAHNNLYGRFLTSSTIDAMAQYYFITSSTNVYYNYAMFDYAQANTKFGFDNAWKKAYELIVNLNVIIEQSGNAPSTKLPEPYYGVVKGEALALRAMLHLDLLRLFGPIWSETNKSVACIPYTTSTKNEVTPLLSSEEIMQHIEEDLKVSIELLRTSDPILTAGVRNNANPAGPNDFYYRQYRLNYFAVKALLARANLWKGDKVNALKNAQEIIEGAKIEGKEIFPFVTSGAAISADKPDRMFSTEVLFSLYTIHREDMYNYIFAANQEAFLRLSFNGGDNNMSRVDNLYDDKNDYRYRIWENVNVTGKLVLTNQKFKNHVEASGRFMMPLIRLSELYLIAAECTSNLEEAKVYLNKIRTNRNVFSLAPQDPIQLKNFITSEFRKEVLGEGQMFFYYKRHAATSIPNHAALVGEKGMQLAKYQVPLPESEISMRAMFNSEVKK